MQQPEAATQKQQQQHQQGESTLAGPTAISTEEQQRGEGPGPPQAAAAVGKAGSGGTPLKPAENSLRPENAVTALQANPAGLLLQNKVLCPKQLYSSAQYCKMCMSV